MSSPLYGIFAWMCVNIWVGIVKHTSCLTLRCYSYSGFWVPAIESNINICGVQPSVDFYKHLSDQPIATAEFGMHSFVPVKSNSDRRRDLVDSPVEPRFATSAASLFKGPTPAGTLPCQMPLLLRLNTLPPWCGAGSVRLHAIVLASAT